MPWPPSTRSAVRRPEGAVADVVQANVPARTSAWQLIRRALGGGGDGAVGAPRSLHAAMPATSASAVHFIIPV